MNFDFVFSSCCCHNITDLIVRCLHLYRALEHINKFYKPVTVNLREQSYTLQVENKSKSAKILKIAPFMIVAITIGTGFWAIFGVFERVLTKCGD